MFPSRIALGGDQISKIWTSHTRASRVKNRCIHLILQTSHGKPTVKFDQSLLGSEKKNKIRSVSICSTILPFGCHLPGVDITLLSWAHQCKHTPHFANITPLISKCKDLCRTLQGHGDSTFKFSWYFIKSLILVMCGGESIHAGWTFYSDTVVLHFTWTDHSCIILKTKLFFFFF